MSVKPTSIFFFYVTPVKFIRNNQVEHYYYRTCIGIFITDLMDYKAAYSNQEVSSKVIKIFSAVGGCRKSIQIMIFVSHVLNKLYLFNLKVSIKIKKLTKNYCPTLTGSRMYCDLFVWYTIQFIHQFGSSGNRWPPYHHKMPSMLGSFESSGFVIFFKMSPTLVGREKTQTFICMCLILYSYTR